MLSSVELFPAMARGRIHPESKEAIAERLYLIRTVKNWTQAFAAKAIGENQATWGWWESTNNNRTPTKRQLVQIEIVTGFPREWVESDIAFRMPPTLERKVAEARERIAAGQGPKKRRN